MRRSNCAGALQYVPELTWILFLRILDEREEQRGRGGRGGRRRRSRRRSRRRTAGGTGPRRTAPSASSLQEGALGAFFGFVNGELLPHLRDSKNGPTPTPRQKVISEIMSGVERVAHRHRAQLPRRARQGPRDQRTRRWTTTHVFTLSQVYEGLLLKMGEKGNDGGQFFTPREIIRAMVRVVDPQIGETIYDPGCGTGGFLAQSFEYMREPAGRRHRPGRAARDAEASARSTAARRTTSSTRLPWPTWCCTASTSRTSGTATR